MSALNVPRYTRDLADVSPTPPSDGQILVYDQPAGMFIPSNAASGASGPAGSPGSVLRNGTGPPSPSLGIDGDYYVDDTTGNFYAKESGTYSLASNIRGPQGVAGATGQGGPPGILSASSPLTYNPGTQTIGVDTTQILRPSSNLSDLPSASTARANLGLGSVATYTASDFLAPSGSGAALTSLSPANIAEGTAAISITGNAATASALSGSVPQSQVSGLTAVLATAEFVSHKGQANGYASLDGGGLIPITQLPSSITSGVSYQGAWNASNNTPTLTSSTGTQGFYYIVSVAGGTDLNGDSTWNIGDQAIFSGSQWHRITNYQAVTSVSGRTGGVTLGVADVAGAAPLDSPSLTGTPTAPNALPSDDSTTLATTAYVKSQGSASDSAVIHLAGAETITGVKTFSQVIVGSISGNAATASALSGTVTESQVTGLTADLAARLLASNDLSDLPNATTACANLGLGSAATHPASDFLTPFGSGASLTSLSPANIAPGTAAISITGNAATATTAVSISGSVPESQVTNLTSDLAAKEATANRGAANGYAPLDAGAKIPTINLPASVLGGVDYQGAWNAATNNPALASGVGTKGYYYKISVAGTTSLDGNAGWSVGDWAVYDGVAWDQIQAHEAVPTVFGRTGAVTAAAGDYTVSQVTGAAALASPALTGVPTAPTAAGGTNTTQVATTAFVAAAVSGLGAGSGTVTGVSASSFAGVSVSVATPTTTPVITLSTTLSGLLKGTGSGFGAAVSGLDYLSPTGVGSGLTSLTAANISAGTAAIGITGNAATATTASALSGSVTESQVSGLTADLAARLLASNNLSDVGSASAARTNLGLGGAATQASAAFDAAGSATAAQAASLQKTNNLSDVARAATARTNLGLGPLATLGLCPPSLGGTGSTSLNLLMNRGLSVVATRCNDLGGGRQADASCNGRVYLNRLYFPKACANLVLQFDNYFANNYYSDINTNDIVVKANVWSDPTGITRWPVYFNNGSRYATLAGNQNVGTRVVSDPVAVYVPAGTYLYFCTSVKAAQFVASFAFTGTVTGGTWTLMIGGSTSDPIAWNASLNAVKLAVGALPSLAATSSGITPTTPATVSVSGTPGSAYTVSIAGGLALDMVAAPTASSSLTGTTPGVTAAAAGAGYFPLGLQTLGASQGTGEGYLVGGTTNNIDTVSSTNFSVADTFSYSPTAVQGFSPSAPFVSVGLLGDSIMRATGDIYPHLGFGVRGLGGGLTTDGVYPYVMMARGGEKITDQLCAPGSVTPYRGSVRVRRGGAATHIVCNTATNDIGAGTTLAVIQANILTLWAQYAAQGCKVYQTTCTPRTNSTDGWRTASSQGFVIAAYESVRAAWNTWLRGGAPVVSGVAASVGASGAAVAGQPGHPLTGVVDTSAAVEVNSVGALTLNGGFWLPPSTTYDSGTSSGVVAVNGNVFSDSSKAWAVNVHQGRRLVVTGGTNAGQARTILSNTATALTLTTGFLAALDATSTYQIDNGTVSLGEPSTMTGFSSGIHPSPYGHTLMGSALASASAAFST